MLAPLAMLYKRVLWRRMVDQRYRPVMQETAGMNSADHSIAVLRTFALLLEPMTLKSHTFSWTSFSIHIATFCHFLVIVMLDWSMEARTKVSTLDSQFPAASF